MANGITWAHRGPQGAGSREDSAGQNICYGAPSAHDWRLKRLPRAATYFG